MDPITTEQQKKNREAFQARLQRSELHLKYIEPVNIAVDALVSKLESHDLTADDVQIVATWLEFVREHRLDVLVGAALANNMKRRADAGKGLPQGVELIEISNIPKQGLPS